MVDIITCPECGRPRAVGYPCPTCSTAAKQPPSPSKKTRPARSGWSRKSPLRIVIALAIFFGVMYGGIFGLHLFNSARGVATAQTSQQGVARYSDSKLGFSFEYPRAWVKSPVHSEMGNQAVPLTEVAFGDPNGASYNDMGIDFVVVGAVGGSFRFTEAMRPLLLSALQQQATAMAGQMPGFALTEPVAEFTTGNGLRGVRACYKASLQGRTIRGEMYFFPSGTVQFQLGVQAAEEDWQAHKPVFDAFIQSFKVTDAI